MIRLLPLLWQQKMVAKTGCEQESDYFGANLRHLTEKLTVLLHRLNIRFASGLIASFTSGFIIESASALT